MDMEAESSGQRTVVLNDGVTTSSVIISWYRENWRFPRLLRVYMRAIAFALEETDRDGKNWDLMASLRDNIIGLHDHKGTLFLQWKRKPYFLGTFFVRAWKEECECNVLQKVTKEYNPPNCYSTGDYDSFEQIA